MFCQHCGAALPELAELCPNCGRRSKAGSTGVVVAIVIAVCLFGLVPFLGILAAIVIPNFIHARREAQTAADKANEKQIAAAIEQYNLDTGRYPPALGALVPKYLTSLPHVPGSDPPSSYRYHRPSTVKKSAPFDVWDDGTRDPTTTTSLRDVRSGARCTTCKFVVYIEGLGLVGSS